MRALTSANSLVFHDSHRRFTSRNMSETPRFLIPCCLDRSIRKLPETHERCVNSLVVPETSRNASNY
jgi:hypothetical protein